MLLQQRGTMSPRRCVMCAFQSTEQLRPRLDNSKRTGAWIAAETSRLPFLTNYSAEGAGARVPRAGRILREGITVRWDTRVSDSILTYRVGNPSSAVILRVQLF